MGSLVAFIVVDHGYILFGHVIPSRRRQGIATRLIRYAQQHHGLTSCPGIVTDAGGALVAATGLSTVRAGRRSGP